MQTVKYVCFNTTFINAIVGFGKEALRKEKHMNNQLQEGRYDNPLSSKNPNKRAYDKGETNKKNRCDCRCRIRKCTAC